jgi:hypothetical protein
MSDDLQRWDLTDQQRTRLLDLALHSNEPGPEDQEELKGDLICDLLRTTLPEPEASPQDSDEPASGICPPLRCITGPPIGEVLCAPATSLDTLVAIKQYAKNQGACAESQIRKDVYLAVYFAAIAAAIVSHSVYITDHAQKDLVQFLGFLAKATWMPANLAGLFSRATELMGTRTGSGGETGG